MMGTQLRNGSTPQSPRQRGGAASQLARRLARALGRALLLLALPLAVCVTALAQPAGVHASQQSAQGHSAALSGSNATLSVSPPSGPVGAHLSATGSRFKPTDPIQIGYSTSSSCASMTPISGAIGPAGSDGSLSLAVTWPQTSAGAYTVCALDTSTNHVTTGANPFAVLSASPATLTLSSPVKSQGQVTVTGANFLPWRHGGRGLLWTEQLNLTEHGVGKRRGLHAECRDEDGGRQRRLHAHVPGALCERQLARDRHGRLAAGDVRRHAGADGSQDGHGARGQFHHRYGDGDLAEQLLYQWIHWHEQPGLAAFGHLVRRGLSSGFAALPIAAARAPGRLA